jgi:tRNA uracil 4-sulfurtransferase
MSHGTEGNYLIKVGEISLKGGNRGFFERLLRKNLRTMMAPHKCTVTGRRGRYFLSAPGVPADRVAQVLSRTFGVVGYAPVYGADKEIRTISDLAVELASRRAAETCATQDRPLSFKIDARRSDKSFVCNSYEIACRLGDAINRGVPHVKVDVRNPEWTLSVEIRDRAYLYGTTERGPGGLPVGSAGRGLLLLSGGIDSPVAGYMMAKRGVAPSAVYFHTYPYTSDEAKEKVVRLAEILAGYVGRVDLWVIPFTDSQLAINRIARPAEVTLLMRSCMIRTSHRIAERIGALCLITGEALSQVASQTAESIRLTNSYTDLPVMRPLIGLDKEEIIARARRIGTYETSILPYDDCCTLFSPQHPVIRPDFQTLREHYEELAIEPLLEKAVDSAEIVSCSPLSGPETSDPGPPSGASRV